MPWGTGLSAMALPMLPPAITVLLLTARGQSPSMAFGHSKSFAFHGNCAPGTSSMRCCRLFVHSLLMVLAVGGVVSAAPAEPPAPVTRPATATAAVTAELESQAATVRSRSEALGIRGVLRLALEAAGAGHDPGAVDDALFCARAMQDLDPDSPHCGNFRWRLGDAAVSDENAVEFAVQLSSVLALDHAAALTPASRERLAALHRDALPAIRRHRVAPGYTNIMLMKIWNLLALGRLGDGAARREGERAWGEWIAFTRQRGITESLCPTYYGVDLDSLGLIASRADDATVRAEAEAVLAYVWTSIAAHWYRPSGRLSGPHARDTDWLGGRGLLDEHLTAAGWIDPLPATDTAGWLPGADPAPLAVFRSACRWPLPAGLDLAVRTRVPRMVVERCGARPWQRSTNHVGYQASIGIAGETRGVEDKSLVVNLGSGPTTINVTLVIDGHGDPYGRRRSPGADGHRKPRHGRPFLVSSQEGNRVTAAWHLDPADPVHRLEGDERRFAAHLVLPLDATVWCDGAARAGGAEMPGAAVFFIEREGAVLAVRSVVPDGAERSPLRWRLVDDGRAFGARRLSAEFAAVGGRPGALLVILDLEVREGLDAEGSAGFRREFGGRTVRAVLSGPRLAVAGSLPLEADLVARRPLVCRPEMADGMLLLVDGVEIGRPLLPLP